MDPLESLDITFLDLSDVDDQERTKVLNSLCTDDLVVQLPWRKVTQRKNAGRAVPDSDHQSNSDVKQSQVNCTVVPQALPQQIYLTNNQVQFSPNYVQSPPPPNPTLYTPPINYTIPPQYVIYPSPPNYQQSYAPTITANNGNYPQNVICTIPVTVSYTYVANDGQIPNANFGPAPLQNLPVPVVFSTDIPEEVAQSPLPTVQQNGVEKQEKSEVKDTTKRNTSSQASRSWASLFNTSKSSDLTNNNSINGSEESFKEAVNEANAEDACPIRHPRKFIDPNCYRMGEFLLDHAVDGRTISLQPRGLINRSNYCYINSILQALLACPPLYNLLSGLSHQNTSTEKEKPTPVIDGMCRFVKEFQHQPPNLRVRRNDKGAKKEQGISIDCDHPFEPSWIYKMLNGIRSDSFLVEGRQEDAEEFLGCLLNGLNDEILELMKLVKPDLTVNKIEDKLNDSDKEWQVMGPKNKGGVTRETHFVKTPISDIFGGFLKSKIYRAGDQSTYNIQPFFTLQLNIEKVKTVREALEALVSKNQLEGVTSEKTNEEVEAWQQVTLDELPVILILHLKCFDFQLDGCTKIIKALEFPIDLKMDAKLLSSKQNTPKERQYKLFAVVYHDGKEASKGHYVTDAFHVGYSSWIRYDDASVKSVQEENVLKPQGTRVPYLLFYRRSDTIRSK